MSTSSTERYALSFTSGGLLMREAALLAPLYLEALDWDRARKSAIERNLLQTRTLSSNMRLTRETVQRVSELTDAEIAVLIEAGPSERQALMWVAACRRYQLIAEFAEEVVRERFLLMNPKVNLDDFDRFRIGKSLWHPELEDLKPSTAQKLRQNLFRMLTEAGLLTDQWHIVPAMLSGRVAHLLGARTPSDIRFFPTTTSAGAEQ